MNCVDSWVWMNDSTANSGRISVVPGTVWVPSRTYMYSLRPRNTNRVSG